MNLLELRTAEQNRKDEIISNLLLNSNSNDVVAALTNAAGVYDDSAQFTLTQSYLFTEFQKAARFAFTASAIPTNFTVKTSSGYLRLLRWDGTVSAVKGTGAPASTINPFSGETLASPYNSRLTKFFGIIPCDSGGTVILPYDITAISVDNSTRVTAAYIRNLTELNSLTINGQYLPKFDLFGLTKLQSLSISSNNTSHLYLRDKPNLTLLNITGNNLRSLDIPNLPNIDVLTLTRNPIPSLDFTKFATVRILNIDYMNLSGNTDFSVFTNIGELKITDTTGIPVINLINSTRNGLFLDAPTPGGDTQSIVFPPISSAITILGSSSSNSGRKESLTSIRAVGTSFTYVRINANLNATALNQFFTDLAPGGGNIDVRNSTGAATCNPTIATAKGYSVTTA